MKQIKLTDFLTLPEIGQAFALGDANAICALVIEPNISRINLALGQENDPMYLAYAVEYVRGQCESKKSN